MKYLILLSLLYGSIFYYEPLLSGITSSSLGKKENEEIEMFEPQLDLFKLTETLQKKIIDPLWKNIDKQNSTFENTLLKLKDHNTTHITTDDECFLYHRFGLKLPIFSYILNQKKKPMTQQVGVALPSVREKKLFNIPNPDDFFTEILIYNEKDKQEPHRAQLTLNNSSTINVIACCISSLENIAVIYKEKDENYLTLLPLKNFPTRYGTFDRTKIDLEKYKQKIEPGIIEGCLFTLDNRIGIAYKDNNIRYIEINKQLTLAEKAKILCVSTILATKLVELKKE